MKLEMKALPRENVRMMDDGSFGPEVITKMLKLPPEEKPVAHFENIGLDFIIIETFCLDPECGHGHAILLFSDPDMGKKQKDDLKNFMVDLDIKTWTQTTRTVDRYREEQSELEEPTEIEHPIWALPLIEEFIKDIPAWYKERLQQKMDLEREAFKRSSKMVETFVKEDFESPLSFTDVFAPIEEPLSLFAEQATAFVHRHGKDLYLIDDLYDLGPGLYSDNTILIFSKQVRDELGSLCPMPVFMAVLQFSGVVIVMPPPPHEPLPDLSSPQERLEILESFLHDQPEAVSLLRQRYGMMLGFLGEFMDFNNIEEDDWAPQYERNREEKDKSYDHQDEKAAANTKRPNPPGASKKTDKVGRNDPCPCGSKKKYKKCCGVGKG